MTVATGGRGNVRARAFTGENLNIRVFRRRRFRSGPSNQGGFWIYAARGSFRVNTVDFEERPDGVCNVLIYRQADFRSLRSSGIWFEILERQESA